MQCGPCSRLAGVNSTSGDEEKVGRRLRRDEELTLRGCTERLEGGGGSTAAVHGGVVAAAGTCSVLAPVVAVVVEGGLGELCGHVRDTPMGSAGGGDGRRARLYGEVHGITLVFPAEGRSSSMRHR